MTVTIERSASLAAPLDALKAYLRISRSDEDALLTDLIRAASDMAEQFIGQLILQRGVEEILNASRDWHRLAMRPVTHIDAVAGVPADGSEFALPVENYALDIDGNGDGWVRVIEPGSAGRIHISYQAGIAVDADGVPDAICHGIIRLAGEYHARRDGLDPQPPASVAALWRPWRRMRLT